MPGADNDAILLTRQPLPRASSHAPHPHALRKPQGDRRACLDPGVGGTASAWESPANPIPAENRQAGSTDWQLTRVRVDADGFRRTWIEGYCSKQSVKAGESIDIMVSTDPPRRFHIEIFRTGYYGGRGARLDDDARAVRGQAQPTPEPGPKNLHECRWDASTRLTIPDDWPSGVYLGRLTTLPDEPTAAVLAELRHLHRPRRPARRRPLSVLGQHLAGVQPLAEQLLRLHPPQGGARPVGRRQLRPPLRPRGPVHRAS